MVRSVARVAHHISDHEEAKSRVEKNTPLSNIPKSVGKIFFSRQLALLQDGTNLRCVVLVHASFH